MQYYNVGKIVNTHGIRGEVRVIATTDFPQERFQKTPAVVLDFEVLAHVSSREVCGRQGFPHTQLSTRS